MLANLFTLYAGVGELILRLALGVTFFAHGRGKLKNPAGFAAFLRQIHVPAPLFNAWLVALLETAGAGGGRSSSCFSPSRSLSSSPAPAGLRSIRISDCEEATLPVAARQDQLSGHQDRVSGVECAPIGES